MDNSDIIDAVGVVSGMIYQWAIEAFAMSPMKVHLIRNGVAAPVRAKARNRSELLRVGFVGRLESDIHKRALDLVPILGALRDLEQPISLMVVGDGPSAQGLAAAAVRFEEFHDVRLLGFINRERIYREIYPDLDCILLTSEHEGSPLVLIEAMRHGIVPVSSRFVGHASEGLLAPEQNCLTFPIGDTLAAAATLRRLAQDKSLLEKLAAGAKTSAAPYNRDDMVRGWMKACSSALDTEPRRSSKRQRVPRQTYGQLERLGLPPMVINTIRQARGKWFSHSSGFDEWPGSLSPDGDLAKRIANKLIAIESTRSATLYQSN
jgi:glycosyltransferase involved in cell wall biosynthesis